MRPAKIFADELEMMHRGQRWYLVARAGRGVVGYCGVLLQHPDAHVTNVAVSPEWQGRGVATRMLLELARRAVDAGFDALTLEVRHTNTGAQALYRSFGFAPAGIRPRRSSTSVRPPCRVATGLPGSRESATRTGSFGWKPAAAYCSLR